MRTFEKKHKNQCLMYLVIHNQEKRKKNFRVEKARNFEGCKKHTEDATFSKKVFFYFLCFSKVF